jgi:hypothetical protein
MIFISKNDNNLNVNCNNIIIKTFANYNMGNCFTNSRSEEDLRSNGGIGPVKEQSKKNHKNPFK